MAQILDDNPIKAVCLTLQRYLFHKILPNFLFLFHVTFIEQGFSHCSKNSMFHIPISAKAPGKFQMFNSAIPRFALVLQ